MERFIKRFSALLTFLSVCLASYGQAFLSSDTLSQNAGQILQPNGLAAVGAGTFTEYWSALNAGISPPSPNAASLGKFGNAPVDMYQGGIRYDIPLFTLKSVHLELPISLGYSSNGLRVEEIGSNIGLGWSLFTGGIITRTVYQNPDETAPYRLRSSWLDNVSPFTVTSTRDSLATFIWQTGNSPKQVDALPDIFQYNIMGASGSFVLSEQLVPQIIKGNVKVKIEFNKTANQFTITDTKGIKYYFTVVETNLASIDRVSDRYKYLDFPTTYLTPPQSLAPLKAATTAWFLTKIEHPQSDWINLTYETGYETYDYGYHEEVRAYITNDKPSGLSISDTKLLKHMMTFGYKRAEKNTCYIKTIKASNDITITFDYGISPRADMLTGGRMMTGFTVTNGASPIIKKFAFTQVLQASSKNTEINLDGLRTAGADIQNRYFLTKVSEKSIDNTKEINHTFAYNDLANLPNRFLRAQDYGGFYNGSTANRLAPCIISGYSTTVSVTADDSNRTPNWQYAQKGLLNSITYPTGGTTVITYEANQSGSVLYPGLRVSKTEDTPGDGSPMVVRKYYYNDYANRATPYAINGITKYDFLASTENYYIVPCSGASTPDPAFYTYRYTTYYSSAINYFNEHFASALPYYPRVTVSQGGSNFEEGGATTYFRDQNIEGCYYLTFRQTKFGVFSNNAMYNGEKEREVTFKLNGTTQIVLTDKLFTYREVLHYTRNCLAIDYLYPDDAPACGTIPTTLEKAQRNYSLGKYKLYGSILLLDKTVTTTYDQNGTNPVNDTETYEYNGAYQVSSISRSGSDGRVCKDAFRYAFDLGTTGVYNVLNVRNSIDYPIEWVRYVGGNVVSAQLNIYGTGSLGGINIIQQYMIPFTTAASSHAFYNGSTYSSSYKKTWDYQYNVANKLKEATYKGGMKTSYIWGYKYTYLVAEVKNVAFNSVGTSDINLTAGLDATTENTIRAVAGTLATTYTWEQQVGMTTSTDPRKVKTEYTYDIFKRLKDVSIWDGSTKRLLQSYTYNYSNQ